MSVAGCRQEPVAGKWTRGLSKVGLSIPYSNHSKITHNVYYVKSSIRPTTPLYPLTSVPAFLTHVTTGFSWTTIGSRQQLHCCHNETAYDQPVDAPCQHLEMFFDGLEALLCYFLEKIR